MPSKFELVAALVREDRYIMQEADLQVGPLLIEILRHCHDLNHQKYDATWVTDAIADIIANWVTDNDLYFPEEEGVGPTIWSEIDAIKSGIESVLPVPQSHFPLNTPTLDIEVGADK